MEITVMFEGMSVKVRSAEELAEVARAKRLLDGGREVRPTDKSEIAQFIGKLPSGAKQAFKFLVDNNGEARAEELVAELGLADNSALGAVVGSPVYRLAKTLNFPVERVFKKVNIVNAKGEKRALKYKIPPEAIEDIREALKPYFN